MKVNIYPLVNNFLFEDSSYAVFFIVLFDSFLALKYVMFSDRPSQKLLMSSFPSPNLQIMLFNFETV